MKKASWSIVLCLTLILDASAESVFEVEQQYFSKDNEITVIIKLEKQSLIACAALDTNEDVVTHSVQTLNPPKAVIVLQANALSETAKSVQCIDVADIDRKEGQQSTETFREGDVPLRNSPEAVRRQRSQMNALELQMDNELRTLVGMGVYSCEQVEELISMLSQGAPGAALKYSNYCGQ